MDRGATVRLGPSGWRIFANELLTASELDR
jgi:hypothetical protein